jgi:uncharacterized spore protein YtfJ
VDSTTLITSQKGELMTVNEVITSAQEAITVKRVYGQPIEKDGVTLIPAAIVGGGAGGGKGRDQKGQEGEGTGFGVGGRPAGVFVLKAGEVSWRPAVDPNRVIMTLGLVLVVYLLSRPRMARVRARVASTRED